MLEKLIEANLPENWTVKVNHFHQGNSSKNFRKGKEYMTIAKVFDADSEMELGKGIAWCHDGECPRRSIGREVAVGRAMREALLTDAVQQLQSV